MESFDFCPEDLNCKSSLAALGLARLVASSDRGGEEWEYGPVAASEDAPAPVREVHEVERELATERLRREHAENVAVALERRMRDDIAAVAEGLAAGFARAAAEPIGHVGRGMAEPHPAFVAQIALVLRHEWVQPAVEVEKRAVIGPPACPECGGVKPEDYLDGPRPRGHLMMADNTPCAWGLLCEQLRHPVITGYPGMVVINFLMGAHALAGMIVTFNDKGHLVPRSKP
jgi:hypothetical protein